MITTQNISHTYKVLKENVPRICFAYFMKYSEEKISVLFTLYLNDIQHHWTCYKSFKHHHRGISGKGSMLPLCISKEQKAYIYDRGAPQIQLSHHNHFFRDDGEKRKINGVEEQRGEGDALSAALAPIAHFLSAPISSEQLRSLRYIIGANQSRMRKALRWNSRNYLPPQPARSLCPLSLSRCALIDGVFFGGRVELGAGGVAAEVQSQSSCSPPSQEGDEIIL